jgi:hypothetical protein
MALVFVVLGIILMVYLNERGKARRERRLIERQRSKDYIRNIARSTKSKQLTDEQIQENIRRKQELEYTRDLRAQGYSDELITTILPTIMNDGK